MQAILEDIERHPQEHLRFGIVREEEIASLEERLGRPLPGALRSVLMTAGNGIFFGKEELFGPRRLMVHDIELLPDMLAVKMQSPGMPDAWVPFHRRDGVMHAVDLSPEGYGQVRSWPDGAARGEIGAFLIERLRRP